MAASVVLVANLLALVHAARNRAGSPEAEVTLTGNELTGVGRADTNDDSGVSLSLGWQNVTSAGGIPGDAPPDWLGVEGLRQLGFDCSVDPASPAARQFYKRQRRRQVFIALEYDGPALRAWNAWEERQRTADGLRVEPDTSRVSRLVIIDADRSADLLRSRHPDRRSILILPAVMGIVLDPAHNDSADMQQRPPNTAASYPARVRGSVDQIPTALHVPRPFSEEFRKAGQQRRLYRVRVRYGASYEPWIIGVEFPNGTLPPGQDSAPESGRSSSNGVAAGK